MHQMHAIHDRPYMTGEDRERLRHVSYFLSHITRPHFATRWDRPRAGPLLGGVRDDAAWTTDPLVIAAASPPDRHGYFSLGVSADYTSSFIGRARVFLEVTEHMPRTFGRNQFHVSQIVGWCQSDRPLVTSRHGARSARPHDRRLRRRAGPRRGDHPDRHRRHPERDHGGAEGARESRHPHRAPVRRCGRSDRGRRDQRDQEGPQPHQDGRHVRARHHRLHHFLHENTAIELWPVRYINDPR